MGRDGKLTTYLSTGMVAIGFVLMFLAWNGAASLDYVQGQVPYLLSGALPGLGLVLTGLTLALVQEIRRSSVRVLDELERATASQPVEAPAHVPTAVPDGEYVVATSATFHDPTCRVVEGRTDLTPMDPATATERGLAACRICEPSVLAA